MFSALLWFAVGVVVGYFVEKYFSSQVSAAIAALEAEIKKLTGGTPPTTPTV
jgi:hypothetical protein